MQKLKDHRIEIPILVLQRVGFLFLFVFYLERAIHISDYVLVPLESSKHLISLIYCLILQSCLLVSIFRPRRILSCACLVLNIIIWSEIPGIYYGADQFTFNLMLFLCFFSKNTQSKPDYIHMSGIIVLFVQLLVIYINNGLAKISEPSWLDGNLIKNLIYPMLGEVGQLLNINFPWLAKTLGLAVIAIQFCIIGILFRRTRKLTAVIFILFHLSIACLLHFFFGLACTLIHCLVLTYDGSLCEDTKRFIFNRWDVETSS